jgi:hypothetical protein
MGGETHPEQISVDSLLRMVETDVCDGFTERSCHPGYVDPDYQPGNSIQREIDLRRIA